MNLYKYRVSQKKRYTLNLLLIFERNGRFEQFWCLSISSWSQLFKNIFEFVVRRMVEPGAAFENRGWTFETAQILALLEF